MFAQNLVTYKIIFKRKTFRTVVRIDSYRHVYSYSKLYMCCFIFRLVLYVLVVTFDQY